jgi:hypothetical protein
MILPVVLKKHRGQTPLLHSFAFIPVVAAAPSQHSLGVDEELQRASSRRMALPQLIEAEKELATEELPKSVQPVTKKRGADPHVPSRIKRERPRNPKEQKLEQGLEESMAGSDPVSITQPAMPIAEKPKDRAESDDDHL